MIWRAAADTDHIVVFIIRAKSWRHKEGKLYIALTRELTLVPPLLPPAHPSIIFCLPTTHPLTHHDLPLRYPASHHVFVDFCDADASSNPLLANAGDW